MFLAEAEPIAKERSSDGQQIRARKHLVSFEEASGVFYDPLAVGGWRLLNEPLRGAGCNSLFLRASSNR